MAARERISNATHNAPLNQGQYEGSGLPGGKSPSRKYSVSDQDNRLSLRSNPARGGNRPSPTTEKLSLPKGHSLQPYLDSYLSNVHPICFQNILHPGVLLEGLEKAPKLLLLAICGASAKFLDDSEEAEKGRRWIAEAKNLAMRDLNSVSTLTLVVLQTIALHDIHEADLLSAWNLTGISIRMMHQLKLNRQSPDSVPTSFLEQECTRRLMWSVFVSDILLASDETEVSDEYVANVGLPCNLWNFTQGTPCTTLRLHDDDTQDISVYRATNPNGYLVRILALKREITSFIHYNRGLAEESPWSKDSRFNLLALKLEKFRRSLPLNMRFEERHMYTFRSTKHLDMFLMVHVWYNQCGCDLFGVWQKNYPTTMPNDPLSIPPPEFLPSCEDKCLYYARQISHLTGKVLKVEPDHLFRDPWLSLCIFDSLKIQLAGLHSRDRSQMNEFLPLLKTNMRALANTRATLVLADKVYEECCQALHNAGLSEMVTDQTNVSSRSSKAYISDDTTIPLLRHYSFLHPDKQQDIEAWDTLFKATEFGASMTREASPDLVQPQHPKNGNVTSILGEFTQTQSSAWDVSLLDENFLSWPNGVLPWDQADPTQSSVLGSVLPVPSTSTALDSGQQMVDAFTNSMSPTTQWNSLNGFDTGYQEMQ